MKFLSWLQENVASFFWFHLLYDLVLVELLNKCSYCYFLAYVKLKHYNWLLKILNRLLNMDVQIFEGLPKDSLNMQIKVTIE